MAIANGDFETAEKEAAGVLALNKEFAKAHLAMALAQLGSGRADEAEATWLRLQGVSAAGRDFAAHGRADLAMYEGRLSDAARILEQAIADPPEGRSTSSTARLMVTLGEVRELQGRAADAVKLAQEAVAQSAEQSIALLTGRVLVGAGRAQRALELASQLEQKLDREAQLYGKLLEGEVDLKRGDARRAVEHFKEAQKLADSWLGRYGLGRAYLAAGVYANAQTELDTCLNTKKGEAATVLLDDVPTYRVMAAARYYMGRAQEGLGSAAAIESYKTFLAIKEKGDEQGLVADARRRVAALVAR